MYNNEEETVTRPHTNYTTLLLVSMGNSFGSSHRSFLLYNNEPDTQTHELFQRVLTDVLTQHVVAVTDVL